MDKESALFYVVLLLFAATGIVTILGLVQKVSIEKKYLNALFAALILELVAALLYLFSNTNFFDDGPPADALVIERGDLPSTHVEITSAETVALFERHDRDAAELGELRQEIVNLRDTLASQNPPYDEVVQSLNESIDEIGKLRTSHDDAVADQERLRRLEKQFLVRMANLNSKISEWGTSINFKWQPEQKRDAALMLQQAFKQIGFMNDDESPDDDPARAHNLLIDYQLAKNFGETGFLTAETIAFIIRDYLAPVSLNGEPVQ